MRISATRFFIVGSTTLLAGIIVSAAAPALVHCVGDVAAFGDNRYGQCDIPAPSGDFAAIAAGDAHSLGLKADGSVVAWGWNLRGENDVPAPNTDFVAVSAGERHSLGLKTDGSIVAWGDNDQGQCTVPAPNTDFVAIVAGDYHSLGLKADGSIVAWGENFYGECDVPEPNEDFVAITAGKASSFGLRANGSIVAWGWNNYGQCNVPSPNTEFVAIASKQFHCIGLKSDGSVVAWGNNEFGQCDAPSPNTGFVRIAAGYWHSLALTADGSIVGWGRNDFGQCDIPEPNTDFVAISGGWIHSLGLRGQNGAQPEVSCGSDCGGLPCEATSANGAPVSLHATASDPDGDALTFHWAVSDASVILDDPDSPTPTGVFPIGCTMATVTVSDGCSEPVPCDVLVRVQDTTPPEVTCTSDVAMLWPPNHTMQTVQLYIVASDAVTNPGEFELLSVTVRSDEADDATGNGDGTTTGDVDGADGYSAPVDRTARFSYQPSFNGNGAWVATIQLRAERDGNGDGRCYTIDATVRDSHGNIRPTSCCIVVPHDRRR